MTHFELKVRKTAGIKKLINNTFPEYRGRKIRVDNRIPKSLDSYWDGGSKSSFVFYNIMTGETVPVHTNHPMFEAGMPRDLDVELPAHVCIVEHVIFCGKDIGIYIHVNVPEAPKALTA
jgi:hypothetical protein